MSQAIMPTVMNYRHATSVVPQSHSTRTREAVLPFPQLLASVAPQFAILSSWVLTNGTQSFWGAALG
jgi:hypothetical protein